MTSLCVLLAAVPLLKVAVMSDIQGHPYPEDAGMRNLERALDVFAALKPDVVVNDGDIGDSGRDMDAVRYYKARCDARLGKIPHVACLGNHELEFIPASERAVRTSERCRTEFNVVFGAGPSRIVHKQFGGCDFIALSFADPEGYAADELMLLRLALDQAVRRDPVRPIFVVTHYHPLDTVNSSSSQRQDGGLRALLDRYPQVVSLSGHSHNPLQDPRSIWQGGFTAIDTSTLCYGCVEMTPQADNQVSCLVPYGHEAVGCLFLEVYRDRMVVRRFSVRDRKEIDPENPWTVDLPYDPSRPKYGFAERRASECTPSFPSDAEPTVWYDYGYVFLMFAAAREPVFGYRVELTAKGEPAKSYFHLSDYYRLSGNRAERVVFKAPPNALVGGKSYRCRIFPVGFFGKEGKSVDWRFDTRIGYPYRKDRPNVLAE